MSLVAIQLSFLMKCVHLFCPFSKWIVFFLSVYLFSLRVLSIFQIWVHCQLPTFICTDSWLWARHWPRTRGFSDEQMSLFSPQRASSLMRRETLTTVYTLGIFSRGHEDHDRELWCLRTGSGYTDVTWPGGQGVQELNQDLKEEEVSWKSCE